MKSRVILAGGIACLLLFPATGVQAQYMNYQSGKPNIEVDMSVLGDAPTAASVPTANAPVAPAAVPHTAPRLLKPSVPYHSEATHAGTSKRVLKPSSPVDAVADAPAIEPTRAIPPRMGSHASTDFEPPIVSTQKKLAQIVRETQRSVTTNEQKPLVSPAPVSSPVQPVSTSKKPLVKPLVSAPVKPAASTAPIVKPSSVASTHKSGVISSPVISTSPEKKMAAVKPPAVKKETLVSQQADEAQMDAADILPPPLPTGKLAAVEDDAFSAPAPVTKKSEVPSLSDLTLNFQGNASEVTPALQQQIGKVVTELGSMPDSRLQIRAYATGEDGSKGSARRIALSRALAVRSYLMDKGVKPSRVDVRALGSETDRSPLDRVDLVFTR